MAFFIYRAKDWNGKTVRGVLEMQSKTEVLETLRESGLMPLSIAEKTKGILDELQNILFGRVGLKQVSTFTRQLATMLTAGLPLTDALSMLKTQAQGTGKMSQVLDDALATVRGGQALAIALGKYRNIFGEAYIASIEAGEQGGVLQEVLLKLADNLEKEEEFKSKVKGAMIYPVIVIVGMIIVASIMMIFVIPKLLSLYKDFGTAKLPAVTVALMNISDFSVKFWFLLPIIFFSVFSVLKAGSRSDKFRLKKDEYMLKIPIMGPLNQTTIMANTLRTMSMMLSAGIPLVDALKIVANVADNELFYQAFLKISEKVQKGFSISVSFEDTGIFPPIVTQMVATGEATGKLDEVLLRVANYFSAEAEQAVKSLTSAIEPLIMIVLGIGVGFLVIAVIMPIYNLTSSF